MAEMYDDRIRYTAWTNTTHQNEGHDYTIGTLDTLQACDAPPPYFSTTFSSVHSCPPPDYGARGASKAN